MIFDYFSVSDWRKNRKETPEDGRIDDRSNDESFSGRTIPTGL